MSSALNISEAASLALHAVVFLASNSDQPESTRDIASVLGVSEAHLSKVLQRLTRAGLVRSTRGPRGGFTLTRPSEEMTLLEVYEAMDGALTQSQCLLGKPICGEAGCILGGLTTSINQQVSDYLTQTKVFELTDRFKKGGRNAA